MGVGVGLGGSGQWSGFSTNKLVIVRSGDLLGYIILKTGKRQDFKVLWRFTKGKMYLFISFLTFFCQTNAENNLKSVT